VGLINLVLWVAGVVLVVVGYTRAKGPWTRYQALKEQDANVARYEAWRGGVRGAEHALSETRVELAEARAQQG